MPSSALPRSGNCLPKNSASNGASWGSGASGF